MIEAAEKLGEAGQKVVIVIEDINEQQHRGETAEQQWTISEAKDIQRGRAYLRSMCVSRQVPVYSSVEQAIQAIIDNRPQWCINHR